MSAEMAATPSNFDAHLSSVGDTPATGGDDSGGSQEVRDNTGPSNDNAWRSSEEPNAEHVNPERPAEEDPPDPTADISDYDDPEAEPVEGEQDEQQPSQDGIPAYEQLQEMYQALQTPELHEGLYDKLVPVDVNGVQVMKPISEVREGFMRMSDYSRGKQELASETRRTQQAFEQTRMFVQRMADPQVFRATLRRLGPAHEKAFEAAAEGLAQEKLQMLRMTPVERQAHIRAMDAERRAEMLEEQARRAPREPPPNPAEQNRPHIEQALNATMGQAWQRHNIRPSPLASELFQRHIQNVWDAKLESIPEAVERASIATAEDLAHLAQTHLGQQAQVPAQQPANTQGQQRRPQPLAPRRLPAGAPPRPTSNAPDKRYRTSNFDDFLKTR